MKHYYATNSQIGWENVLFELGSERDRLIEWNQHPVIFSYFLLVKAHSTLKGIQRVFPILFNSSRKKKHNLPVLHINTKYDKDKNCWVTDWENEIIMVENDHLIISQSVPISLFRDKTTIRVLCLFETSFSVSSCHFLTGKEKSGTKISSVLSPYISTMPLQVSFWRISSQKKSIENHIFWSEIK